jgi:hypothetical protein
MWCQACACCLCHLTDATTIGRPPIHTGSEQSSKEAGMIGMCDTHHSDCPKGRIHRTSHVWHSLVAAIQPVHRQRYSHNMWQISDALAKALLVQQWQHANLQVAIGCRHCFSLYFTLVSSSSHLYPWFLYDCMRALRSARMVLVWAAEAGHVIC